MTKCIFCDIVAQQQPASIVYQDKVSSAFMDIQPINEGHLLVIPNRHASSLAELPEEIGTHLFSVARQLTAQLYDSGLRCEGVNLFIADGPAAGQEVMHVHIHVIPRFRGDGFGFRFGPSYGRRPQRTELDKIADQIRQTQ